MYISIEEAKEIVWKRWNNVELRKQVKEYLGDIPAPFHEAPRSVLFRQIVSPNFESHAFCETSQNIGLNPLCLEFTGDKFCTRNPEKVLMGKMMFCAEKGEKGEVCKTSNYHLFDFTHNDMKCFSEIRTFWGESFVDFSRSLTAKHLPNIEFIDTTKWIRSFGNFPQNYYHRFLALFICHGTLFENFLDNGAEKTFTSDIIRPAIQSIKDHFGIQPLIVRLVPREREEDRYWSWYPRHIEQEVKALLAGKVAESISTRALKLNQSP
jgi:hypothetical protein